MGITIRSMQPQQSLRKTPRRERKNPLQIENEEEAYTQSAILNGEGGGLKGLGGVKKKGRGRQSPT